MRLRTIGLGVFVAHEPSNNRKALRISDPRQIQGEEIMAIPSELDQIRPDKQVDARGTACPGPLLEAKRAITSIPVNGVMELLSSDESTNNDVPRWAKKIGHEYLGMIEEAGYWRIFVKRGK